MAHISSPIQRETVLFLFSVAIMAIPSARSGLVSAVDSGGIYFFCQCWHWFLLQWAILSSLAAAAATMGLITIGGIALAGGGLVFGSGGNEALFFMLGQ